VPHNQTMVVDQADPRGPSAPQTTQRDVPGATDVTQRSAQDPVQDRYAALSCDSDLSFGLKGRSWMVISGRAGT
jgi:hypothetical protein